MVDSKWLNEHRWMLRASDNGIGYGGYKRKRVGAWNCSGDNWTGKADCDTCGGFFGIDQQHNGFGLNNKPTIELCEVRGDVVVIGGNKICVQDYRVVAVNADIPDAAFEQCGYMVGRGEIEEISSGRWLLLGATVQTVSGGEVWSYGTSTVQTVSGGLVSAYDNSTVQTVSGGLVSAYDNSTVQTVSGGEVSACGNSTVVNDLRKRGDNDRQ